MMFGGLHLEMAMWNMLGSYLAHSGWTVALTEAGIASSRCSRKFLDSFSFDKNSARTPSYHCSTVKLQTLFQAHVYQGSPREKF